MSEKGMAVLAKKNVLFGFKNAYLQKCTHCFAGKQHRVSFKSHPPSRILKIFDLVKSNICGPMKIVKLWRPVYCITFINDHSRKL